ncbi:hypothetical protein H4R19_000147 [Coemansia spiralis]|nr:hypothetical protein H4R19_000147 [Coemansia spiralis]
MAEDSAADGPARSDAAASDSEVDLDESAFRAPSAALGGMATDTDEQSESDNDNDNDQEMGGRLGDMNGGFLGDFEEIEEDEDVQRFMSLNNTPSMSTRESPEARGMGAGHVPDKIADDGSDENEEDGFETISERTAAGADGSPHTNGHGLPATRVARAVPMRDAGAPLRSGYLLPEDLARLMALQKEFHQSAIPKLPSDHLFISPDVYRRYSVLPTAGRPLEAAEVEPDTATAATAGVPEAAPPKPVASAPPPPKPSSLRTSGQQSKVGSVSDGGDRAGNNNSAGDADTTGPGGPHTQPTTSPMSPVPRRPRSKSTAGDEDDVVDTLLGAMGSGKPRASPPLARPAGGAQQTIPNDMLVAMMAIEGVSVDTVPKAPAAADGPAKAMAARLPKGYAGPFSQLTADEHARLLALAPRAKAKALGAMEAADYQRLKAKVDGEQLKFREAAREKALPQLRYIAEGVAQHACREWSRAGAEVLEMYPRMYAPVRVRAIRSSTSGYVPLVYRDTLFQTGACHHIADAMSGPVPALPVPSDMDPWATQQGRRLPMSRDAVAADLAHGAGADVAISSSALIALLTLPQAFAQDVVVPFTVVDVAGPEGESGGRRRVVFDKPLPPAPAATPHKLSQMFYERAIRAQAGDPDRPLELSGGSMASRVAVSETAGTATATADNANYTLWEFGGLSVLIRYSVDGYVHGDGADAAPAAPGAQPPPPPPAKTTVTLAAKMERQLGNTSPEARLAAGGSGGGRPFEDVGEGERLAWWMACYLRGNPSETWVSHVDVQKSAVARVTRHTCGDLYPAADTGGAQPSTRGVLDLLQDLLRLPAGQYMLAHRRRTYDATIYKALENQGALAAAAPSQRTTDSVMDLAAEIGPVDPAALAHGDVDGDYVPVTWHGLPGQIPHTYAPADLQAHCAPAAVPPWKGAAGATRGRRRPGSKRKKAKHA